MEWVGETLFLSHNSIRNSGAYWKFEMEPWPWLWLSQSKLFTVQNLNSVFHPQLHCQGSSLSCSQAGMPMRSGQPYQRSKSFPPPLSLKSQASDLYFHLGTLIFSDNWPQRLCSRFLKTKPFKLLSWPKWSSGSYNTKPCLPSLR